MIPNPKFATCIIATSFPPSPIHAILLPLINYSCFATLAFCFGWHRAHITPCEFIEDSIKVLGSSFRIIPRAVPSMSKILFRLLWLKSISLFLIAKASLSFISKKSYVLVLIPAITAIHLAVATLSPVNIHTLIPAFLIDSIVIATSSYNLSSTPVTPRKSISFSSRLAAFWMAWSRFCIWIFALSCLRFQDWYCSSVM